MPAITSIYGDDRPGDVDTGIDGSDTISSLNDSDEIFAQGGNDNVDAAGGNNTVDLGEGNDTLNATDGDNTVMAGPGNDNVTLNDGNNVVHLGTGNDVFVARDGNNEVHGEDGDDNLTMRDGVKIITTGVGQDNVVMRDGDATVDLGADNDTLMSRDGDHVIMAGTGVDDIELQDGDNEVHLGDGNDFLVMRDGVHLVFGGSGNDNIEMRHGDAEVFGEDGMDNITTGDGVQFILGGADDDTIVKGIGTGVVRGNGGNDNITIAGGDNTVMGDGGLSLVLTDISDSNPADDGNDIIVINGGGNNLVLGSGGMDIITTSTGNDDITGGAGNDTIRGGGGINEIFGNDGNDTIYGNLDAVGGDPLGQNQIDGGDGDDDIWGDLGDDVILGGEGEDEIHGLGGNDDIFGGTEDDMLFGGDGDDFIEGNLGDDIIRGGDGNDVAWGGFQKHTRAAFALDQMVNPEGWDESELVYPTDFIPNKITPTILNFQTIDGDLNDGEDDIQGNNGTDWLFGGAENDIALGGPGDDYIDGGVGTDDVQGQGGNDVVRGGGDFDVVLGDYRIDPGDPVIIGDEGIDQIYGDGGDDFLFGGPTPAIPVFTGVDGRVRKTTGQRLFGGDGTDFLYAWAEKTIFNAGFEDQFQLQGDELHGGSGVDWLWGNLRQDVLLGDRGNDYLHGDFLAGPRYAENEQADLKGASDLLIGGTGEDQIFGGGGNDTAYGGGDTDWLEGQDGNDTLYGGGGIDVIVADVSSLYVDTETDVIDGHFLNAPDEFVMDDNAVDILLVIGQPIIADRISIGQTDEGRTDGRAEGIMHIDYNDRDLFLPWRSAPTAEFPKGQPLVEQIRVGGLSGDDLLEFRREAGLDNGGEPVEPLDIGDLTSRTTDYVGVLDGNSGDDILIGTEGRDRLDGGSGSDVMFGFGGDDRLWSDSTFSGNASDHDVMFGGQGEDDMVGSALGTNEIFAWSRDPGPVVTQLRFQGGTTATGTDSTPAVLRGFAPGPDNGRLRADMHFALSVNGADPVDVLVSEQQASNNTTLQNLVDDLNIGLQTAGLDALVEAVLSGDFVEFRALANGGTLALELRQFGVFVGSLRDDNGDLDGDGFRDSDPTKLPYPLEDTGLDRMLGSPDHDELYGGTGLAFMFGNGAPVSDPDRLWRADGTLFESLDGGLLGDDWKEFAKETGKIWYVGGTDADDVISVDYVSEPGLLRDRHLVTRLTNNDGNITFAAQVNLEFNATDADGNPLWDPEDVLINVEAFQARGDEEFPNVEDVDTDLDVESIDLTIEEVQFNRIELEESLLPPEADSDVILIDALGGNDQVFVGPTVQRTVWVDAGTGDDKVVISSGNTVLVDKGELGKRNDLSQFATVIADDPQASNPILTESRTLEGLTIDNPADVDWFRFTLTADAGADAVIELSSASDLDGLALELHSVGPDGQISVEETAIVQFSEDGTEADGGHNTLATAFEFENENAIYGLGRVRGLSIHDETDVDFFKFELTDPGTENDRIGLLLTDADDVLRMDILDEDGVVIVQDAELAELARTVSLDGLEAGDYFLRVTSQSGAARYELVPQVGVPITTTADEDDRSFEGTSVLDLSGKQASTIDIDGLVAGEYLLKVSSPRQVPTEYDLTIRIDNVDPVVESFTTRTDVVRRDVILGGPGNDILIGGAGEDWILGEEGNDVLSGGYDRQAEDLLIGGTGDDTFQILPDLLPFLKGTTETYIPTVVDVLQGGEGDDRVLFLGGDFDELGRPVPDNVAIRWNRFLHRYEFTALVWDTANQQYVPDGEAVAALGRGPVLGSWEGGSPAVFQLSVDGADFVEVTVPPDVSNTGLVDLVFDIQQAINNVLGEDVVIVESPNGILRLVAPGVSLELRAEESDPAVEFLKFAPLSSGEAIFQQAFAFYQTFSVEHTVIETRAGDDVVHGDPEFLFQGVESEWGIDPGDFEQRALISNLEIHGGDGADQLFGGAGNDIINGGDGADLIVGGQGDDEIDGGPGADLIAGNTILTPDRFEFGTFEGQSGRNDVFSFAGMLPQVRTGTTIDFVNFHVEDKDDWYVIPAPEAMAQFGDTAKAILTRDMITVTPMDETVTGLVEVDGEDMVFYLFPAEDTDPGEGVSLVPRERFSGVPDYYLLHVLNLREADDTARGFALEFDATDTPLTDADYLNVGSDSALEVLEQLTMEAWIKPLDLASGPDASSEGIILRRVGEYELIRRADGGIDVGLANGGSLVYTDTGISAAADQWKHLSVSFDRGDVSVYEDGLLVKAFKHASSTIGDSDLPDDNFTIGGRDNPGNPDDGQTFDGVIDEVRVWSTARSASEIGRDYNRVLEGNESGLAGYWRFEDKQDADPIAAGDQVRDLTANGNHGTLENDLAFGGLDSGTDRLRVPGGEGIYRISFGGTLGETLHVPGQEADSEFSSVDLSGQPVVIPLGDIDNDGIEDSVVAVRDRVLDINDPDNPKTFATIAFGGPDGLDLNKPIVTLQLPAPILSGTTINRSIITPAGDIDGDGIDDVAIAVTRTSDIPEISGTQGVYILFGREDWSPDNSVADPGLLGEYFLLSEDLPDESLTLDAINLDLLTPIHTRVDAQINFPQTLGPGFGGFSELTDNFAIRWTGQINIDQTGSHTFFLSSNDGSRLYIDDVLVIDNDGVHDTEELSGVVSLTEGLHTVRVEMFENTGLANVQLRWTPPGSITKQTVPASVLFGDPRGTIDVLAESDVFIPVSAGPVDVAGAGNLTSISADGLFAEFFDIPESVSLVGMPGLADGKMLINVGPAEAITTISLTDLPEHDTVSLEFLLAILDGWTGDAGPTRFNVRVDGVSIFSETFTNDGGAQSFSPAPGVLISAGTNEVFSSGRDSLYDFGRTPFEFAHKESTLTIELFADGAGYTGGKIQSWGIDNLVISVGSGGSDFTPVYLTDFNGDLPEQVTGGRLGSVQGFGPDVTRLEERIAYVNTVTGLGHLAPDFSGFDYTLTEIQGRFVSRFTGDLFFEPSSGDDDDVSFVVISDDGHRLFVDDVLVFDADEVTSVGNPASSTGSINLTRGFHTIRLEHFQESDQALIAFGWDPANGTDFEYFDQTPDSGRLVQRDGEGVQRDDLVISSGNKIQVFGGRSRAQWLLNPESTVDVAGSANRVATLGDITADGASDLDDDSAVHFGTVGATSIRIFEGSADLLEPTAGAQILGSFTGFELLPAGDVDGDTAQDFLIVGDSIGWLVYGDASLMNAGPVSIFDLMGSGLAEPLPDGQFRGIGDFNGDGLADLGSARMTESSRLNEQTTLQHQVTEIYFGDTRVNLEARFMLAPDMVIEPGRASYVQSGQPESLFFGPLGTLEVTEGEGEDAVTTTFTKLANAGPAGDSLRFYEGNDLGPVQQGDVVGAETLLDARPYRYDFATPVGPNVGPREVPGINVATDANPFLRDAFALRGDVEQEALGGVVPLEDFNGDGQPDLLVFGEEASYILLGPVDLSTVIDIREEADIIISADVGRPASRMGDINGVGLGGTQAGLSDLVFIRTENAGQDAVVTVILGGDGDGIELPRIIDRDWVNTIDSAPSQDRVRQADLVGFGELSRAGASFSVLNWDDDGFADVLLSFSQPLPFFGTVIMGFMISGESLWIGENSESAVELSAVFTYDVSTDLRQDRASQYVGGEFLPFVTGAGVLQAVVAGDVNGDGLDDVIFTDSNFVTWDPGLADNPPEGLDLLPDIGRAYLATGRQQANPETFDVVDLLVGLGSGCGRLFIRRRSVGARRRELRRLRRFWIESYTRGPSDGCE